MVGKQPQALEIHAMIGLRRRIGIRMHVHRHALDQASVFERGATAQNRVPHDRVVFAQEIRPGHLAKRLLVEIAE